MMCSEMSCDVDLVLLFGFFFQAEDGIRDLVRSRGLGDVYKRQVVDRFDLSGGCAAAVGLAVTVVTQTACPSAHGWLSLIHI